jgi:hypothetical protein
MTKITRNEAVNVSVILSNFTGVLVSVTDSKDGSTLFCHLEA